MKNEVIEYVMNSPGNTNRAVLVNLLDKAIGSGGMSVIDVGNFNNAVAGKPLSADVNAALDAAYASGMPIITKGILEGMPIALVCHLMPIDETGAPTYYAPLPGAVIVFKKMGGTWTCGVASTAP